MDSDIFCKGRIAMSASWVIRSKETGRVLFETFDKQKVDMLNTERYEALPIQTYLASLNGAKEAEDEHYRTLAKVSQARMVKISALEEALHQFMEFQISDYHRSADMAKRYCEIRRHARKVLAQP